MNVSKNFILEEFVDKGTFEKFGDKSLWFINPDLINIYQKLRDRFGSVTINNWSFGGNRHWSGLRTYHSPYYSMYSQHSFGNAGDGIFKNFTAEEVRQDIKKHEAEWIALGVGAIEENVSWLHIDTRNIFGNRIKFFKP